MISRNQAGGQSVSYASFHSTNPFPGTVAPIARQTSFLSGLVSFIYSYTPVNIPFDFSPNLPSRFINRFLHAIRHTLLLCQRMNPSIGTDHRLRPHRYKPACEFGYRNPGRLDLREEGIKGDPDQQQPSHHHDRP